MTNAMISDARPRVRTSGAVERPSAPLVISAGLAVAAFIAAALSPENSMLWLMAALAILLSGAAIGKEAAIVPSLFLIVFVYWITVVCDLVLADLDGVALSSQAGGPARETAVMISFLVLFVMSVGMRIGFDRRRVIASQRVNRKSAFEPRLTRAFRFYIFSTIFVVIIGVVARLVPPLAQPLGALASLKLVSLFILVICLKRTPSGISLMAVLMVFEGSIGISSYIASFQSAFLTIIAAALSGTAAARLRATDLVALTVGGIIMVGVSVVWTAVKPEFRALIATADLSTSERVNWISDQVMDGHIDYVEAARNLIRRVGYTQFYGLALARQQDGLIPPSTFWLDAVKNVVMPRVLFPDKASLNDTAITTMLTGVHFDEFTSVSIGYVAQAQIDFGFPAMLLPLGLLGYLIGYACRYLLSSNGSFVVAQGFVASCTCGAFLYGANFEKCFGAFALAFLALLVIRRWSERITKFCS